MTVIKLRNPKELPEISDEDLPHSFPKYWEIDRLGNFSLAITKGATPTTYGYSFQAEGISFIKVENVKRGRIVRELITDFISEEANQNHARSQLEVGDILFSIAGTIGKACVVMRACA